MDNLEKQLICPICLEMFSKPVVILPCQHNLCRKCANDIFQASNPYLPTRGGNTVAAGGRFRCPSCRHEVVLDRHGVYGLQRNLLVENIIDLYKQESTSYRVMQVTEAPLLRKERHAIGFTTRDCIIKTSELSDGIAMLVGNNDRIQGIISQLEESCRTIEENCRRQKSQVCEKFDFLYATLEERKGEMTQKITSEQEEKLQYVRTLKKKYGDHLEAVSKIVESGIQSMDEPEMALFLQTGNGCPMWCLIYPSGLTTEEEEEEAEEGEEEEGEGDEEVHTEPESDVEEGATETPVKQPEQTAVKSEPAAEAACPPTGETPPQLANIPVQGAVEQSGSLGTAETGVLSTEANANPLLYPSWYKPQTGLANSPTLAQSSDGIGQLGASVSPGGDTQKAAAVKESPAVDSKESRSSAATSQNAKPLVKKITEASDISNLEKVERGYENMDHFKVNFEREGRGLRSIDFIREEEEEEAEEGEEEEGEGDEEVHTEPESDVEEGATETPVKQPEQTAVKSEPAAEAACPPTGETPPQLANIPVQGAVEQSGSLGTAETGVLSTEANANPLLYPSWYKPQTGLANSPTLAQSSDGIGQLGASVSPGGDTQKAAAVKESPAVDKEEEEEAEEGEEEEGEGDEEVHTEPESDVEEGATETPVKQPEQTAVKSEPAAEAACPPTGETPPQLANIPVQGAVEQSGSLGTAETGVLSTEANANPLLYPSWYKPQTGLANSPTLAQSSDGIGQLGASVSPGGDTQKAAAVKESPAVDSKESRSSAATSQMHWDFDMFIRNRVDTSPSPVPWNTMCKHLFGFVGVMLIMFWLGETFPAYQPVAPKQYPYNNLHLERGGDPDKQPEELKHYEI
ncbi:UNVERIFIED_CONTAM: hypothetical protein FKN15_069431 [Acipenser sinensis]